MIILGIDPGYAIVGYGVIEFKSNRFSVVDYGAITTTAGTPFERRLELIYDDLNLLMGKFHPEAMSIEKLFYNTNAKTVIDVAQARGVTVLAAKKIIYPYLNIRRFRLNRVLSATAERRKTGSGNDAYYFEA